MVRDGLELGLGLHLGLVYYSVLVHLQNNRPLE